MAGRTTVNQQIIRKALAENPTIATETLARMLRTKFPECFHSVDACRQAIQRSRGAHGKSNRCKVVQVRTPEESEACRRWGQLIPEPEPNDWRWHELPDGVDRWLILADLHLPYHDKTAVAVALEHAAGNCDGVLLLGDAMDSYQMSAFERDPRRRSLQAECDAMAKMLDILQGLPGVKRVVWKFGNHEKRVRSYIRRRAPELEDFLGLSLEENLQLKERGIQLVPEGCPIRHRALGILHGHEWGGRFYSPVNPARGAYLRAHSCVLVAHEHRSSYNPESNLFGVVDRAWSVGCLANLHPEWKPLNRWEHGFAYLTSGSEWRIDNHSIIDNKVF